MVPPSTRTRRRRERADRTAAILSAARQVFFEDGIRNATVDAIAARAQVAKGTVYLYFQNKEAILASLLLEGLESLNARLESAFEGTADAEARLSELAYTYYRFSRQEQDYFRLMTAFDRGQFRESIRPDLYDSILDRSLNGFHWLVRAVEQGMQAGAFVRGDSRQVAGALWAALNGVLVLAGHPLRREMLAREVSGLYEQVLGLMLRGMRPPAPAALVPGGVQHG